MIDRAAMAKLLRSVAVSRGYAGHRSSFYKPGEVITACIGFRKVVWCDGFEVFLGMLFTEHYRMRMPRDYADWAFEVSAHRLEFDAQRDFDRLLNHNDARLQPDDMRRPLHDAIDWCEAHLFTESKLRRDILAKAPWFVVPPLSMARWAETGVIPEPYEYFLSKK
jgi:hypothetical protein